MNLFDMSDQEFFDYLQAKYGENWMLVSLTSEEFERLPRRSPEEIKAALEQGRKDRLAVENYLKFNRWKVK